MNDKRNVSSFLEEFLSGNQTINPSDLSRNAIRHDRYDEEDYESVMEEMREMAAAEDKLTDVVDTGGSAFADQFFSLMKADPELEDPRHVRPSHQVNHAVAQEAMELKEWEELRCYSVGDEIASALGCVAMEPELETLFDKLKKEQELAKSLQDQLDQYMDLDGQESSLDELIKQLEDGDPSDPQNAQQAQNYQDQKAALEAAKQALANQMAQGQQELSDQMAQQASNIKSSMQKAMGDAADAAKDAEETAQAWGLDPGSLQKMPYEKRIELARKLNNERFRRIAKLFGPMQRMAFAEQQRKTTYTPEEVYDIEKGNDLNRVLPAEMIQIRHPLLRFDFYRRYFEGDLLQYKMKGTEKLAKGGIIFCEDGSGSMSGDREIWAKAVGLTLLQIAKAQKRPFYGIHFGGPRTIKCFDFRDPKNATVEQVIEFAETFFGGGPLRVDQRVVTPEGWVEIGNLRLGDTVFGPDGLPTEVLGVFPQGNLDLYRMKFSDGTEVMCDGTHRWTVEEYGVTKTLTVNAMIEKGLERVYDGQYGQDRQRQRRFRIPTTSPVEFGAKELALDPYLMGYLLGDGSFCGSSLRITAEGDDLPWVDALPEGARIKNYEKREGFCPQYGISYNGLNPVTEGLRSLGMWGLSDDDKYIPDEYLWGSVEQRWALLQGLLDSDGSYSKPGRVEFTNISRKLADGVVQLVQSLGGGATITERNVRPNERPLFRVAIMLNQKEAPFRIIRKSDRWEPRAFPWVRSIVSIERDMTAPAVCIKVNREDGLFLTEGFAVTHNTDFATPLSKAVDILREEHMKIGAVKADIVFCTDGECGVPEQWLKDFKAEQERMAFRVYGVVIGGSRQSEPLNTIADGRVLTVKDLHRGDDLREVFRNL